MSMFEVDAEHLDQTQSCVTASVCLFDRRMPSEHREVRRKSRPKQIDERNQPVNKDQ